MEERQIYLNFPKPYSTMKKLNSCLHLLLLISLLAVFFLVGCDPIDEWEPAATQYTPIMMKRSDMESIIKLERSRDIHDPAKIYRYEQYLFISERYEGIHIIDNRNPAAPVNQGFIRIPGCVDIATKGNTLYADNATDLIALDISDPAAIRVVSRVENAFPVLLPPDLGTIPEAYQNRPEDMIIIEWRK